MSVKSRNRIQRPAKHSGFGRARKQAKAGESSETVRRLG